MRYRETGESEKGSVNRIDLGFQDINIVKECEGLMQ